MSQSLAQSLSSRLSLAQNRSLRLLALPSMSFNSSWSRLCLVNLEVYFVKSMHVFSNSRILLYFYINCVDPDDEGNQFNVDFLNELCSLIEREDERHAQLLKEEVISINSKDQSDPRMTQIGSTLFSKKQSALADLFKRFFNAFTWFYQDVSDTVGH